jgi:uncharacterized protein (TIGR04551 family)
LGSETPGKKPGDLDLDEWNRDDWMLLKPDISLIDLSGYFRMRADALRRLDFNNQSTGYPAASGNSDTRKADFNGTNIRLRLEPTINVSRDIQVVTTIDFLDNLILGSTPNSFPPGAGDTPIDVLSRSQVPPQAGSNSLNDSVVIKRAYGRVSALNEQLELRFGRMPDHWGLGMMTNSGDCLDCDFGDVVDRFALTFKAIGHIWVPMYDWVGSGPFYAPFGNAGQTLDAANWDDTTQYSLRIMKVDHPDDIRHRVAQGSMVLNYGLWNIIRQQVRGVDSSYYDALAGGTTELGTQVTPAQESRRNAKFFYTGNGYFKLHYGEFELGAEAAIVLGEFDDEEFDSKTKVRQVGVAIEGLWKVDGKEQGTRLSVKAGGASGDSAPGFGVFNPTTQRYQPSVGGLDNNIDNFQFSPDYHIDLLLFRHILGTVTDAWYIRPSLAHMFNDKVRGSLAAVYSQAMFSRSTPSAGGTEKAAKPLGLEFDAELSYGLGHKEKESPFGASFAGGLLFPFGGFDNALIPVDDQDKQFAWTLQLRAYISF